MSQKSNVSDVASPPGKSMPTTPLEPIPVEVATILDQVAENLEDGNAKKALDLIQKSRVASPWLRNAVGVCHLRLGDMQAACSLFRGLAVTPTLLLRDDVPPVFKGNYATSLLLSGNLAGAMNVLAELKDAEHPTVPRLKGAVQRWKAGLTFWQKLQWYTGGEFNCVVQLDFPPGDLQ